MLVLKLAAVAVSSRTRVTIVAFFGLELLKVLLEQQLLEGL